MATSACLCRIPSPTIHSAIALPGRLCLASVVLASGHRCAGLRLGDRPQQALPHHFRQPAGRSRIAAQSGGVQAPAPPPLITFSEVQAIAQSRNLVLSLQSTGPFYSITCRAAGAADSPVLAESSGFVAPPFKLLHCDVLQIFATRSLAESGVDGGPMALSVLVGLAVVAHGHDCGCAKAEILAINDDETWHKRLVRYYTFLGFKVDHEVGGRGLVDIPHLLVWGGEGTRMNADIVTLLRRWAPAVRRSKGRSTP